MGAWFVLAIAVQADVNRGVESARLILPGGGSWRSSPYALIIEDELFVALTKLFQQTATKVEQTVKRKAG